MTANPIQPQPADEAIGLFISQLKSGSTAAAYLRDLNQLRDFVSASGITFQTMTTPLAYRYVASLRGLSARSVCRKISAARSFYRYLLFLEEVKGNPFAGVIMPAIDPKSEVHKVLQYGELEKCLQVLAEEVKSATMACEAEPSSRSRRRRHFFAVRRRAIVVLFATTGLGLSEMLNLQRTDIEQTTAGFQLIVGGSDKRMIPVRATSLPALVDWLKIRNTIPTTNKHVIIGYAGAPCTRMSIRQVMKWLQKRVDTNYPLQPRLFRRSYARWHMDTHLQAAQHLGAGAMPIHSTGKTTGAPIALSKEQLGIIA